MRSLQILFLLVYMERCIQGEVVTNTTLPASFQKIGYLCEDLQYAHLHTVIDTKIMKNLLGNAKMAANASLAKINFISGRNVTIKLNPFFIVPGYVPWYRSTPSCSPRWPCCPRCRTEVSAPQRHPPQRIPWKWKNGFNLANLGLFFVYYRSFSNKQYKVYIKFMYPVLGFKLMTYWLWVSSFNH